MAAAPAPAGSGVQKLSSLRVGQSGLILGYAVAHEVWRARVVSSPHPREEGLVAKLSICHTCVLETRTLRRRGAPWPRRLSANGRAGSWRWGSVAPGRAPPDATGAMPTPRPGAAP